MKLGAGGLAHCTEIIYFERSADPVSCYHRRVERTTCALVVVCIASACSHGTKQRVLTDKVSAWACAVDDNFVYVVANDAFSKVSRQTGAVEFLTNDAHNVDEMVPVDGSLYWSDRDGVHVWAPDAKTRRSIAEFPLNERPTSLARFRDKLCWGRRDQNDDALVECFDLAQRSIVPWFTRSRAVNADIVTYADRMYTATANLGGNTTVLDVTNPSSPVEVFTIPGFEGIAATPLGPVLIGQVDRDGKYTVWLSADKAVALHVPSIQTIAGHTYGHSAKSDGPVRVDLNAATETPVPGAKGEVLCGDSKALYATGARGELLQLPAPG